jgi:hypothetical protein
LHPIEHPECRINAGLGRLSVATDDAKLRIPTPHEEMSVAAGTIIIIVTHGARATFTPVVVAIPVPIPSVAAIIPPPMAIIIVISR